MTSSLPPAPTDGGQVPGLQLQPAAAITRPMVTGLASEHKARMWHLGGQMLVEGLARAEATEWTVTVRIWWRPLNANICNQMLACVFLPVLMCMHKCQFQVCNVTILFTILNSVISAQFFPHDETLLLLFFPHKDQQCSKPLLFQQKDQLWCSSYHLLTLKRHLNAEVRGWLAPFLHTSRCQEKIANHANGNAEAPEN
jgi:hypothetical protein